MNFMAGDYVKGRTTGCILRIVSLEEATFTGEMIEFGTKGYNRQIGHVSDGWAYCVFDRCEYSHFTAHETKTVGDLV